MSNYIIQNGELCHYGVPGMKWGVRRAQRAEKKAAKKLAKEEYRKDVEKAVEEANSKGDHTSAYYMEVSLNRGANYFNYMKRNLVVGLAASALVSQKTKAKGEKLARNLIIGSLGGMTYGALKAASRTGRGSLIAENNYGVKPLHERLKQPNK